MGFYGQKDLNDLAVEVALRNGEALNLPVYPPTISWGIRLTKSGRQWLHVEFEVETDDPIFGDGKITREIALNTEFGDGHY